MSDDDGNRWIYWVVGGVVVLLLVIGLIAFSGAKTDREAQEKAATLTQKLKDAGLRAPADQDIFIRSFGTDGGAVCDNPGKSLGKAILFNQLTNGASHVGQRPVIVDGKALRGELLVLQTYCPDKLQDYRDAIDDLKVDDVIKD